MAILRGKTDLDDWGSLDEPDEPETPTANSTNGKSGGIRLLLKYYS